MSPYLVATAYVNLEKRDQAIQWLQKALEDHDEWLCCLNVDPALDLLRADQRFEDLVRRCGPTGVGFGVRKLDAALAG